MTPNGVVERQRIRAAEDARARAAWTVVDPRQPEPVVDLPSVLSQRQVRGVLEALGCRRAEQCAEEWLLWGVCKFWSTSTAGVEQDPIVVRRVVQAGDVQVVPVDSPEAWCSTSYCAGANGWGGPEYPTCSGCNADGTRTVPAREGGVLVPGGVGVTGPCEKGTAE